MHAILQIRVGPFSFGRALGFSLVLHALALSLPRPGAHRHELAYTGPLVVQLRSVTAPAARRLAPEAPQPEEQGALPHPVPKKNVPRPRQRLVPAISTPPVPVPFAPQGHVATDPTMLERKEAPAAPPSASTAPAGPSLPGPVALAPAVKEAPHVSQPGFSAAYLNNPKPPYPISARRNGEAGTSFLKVLVTREGQAGKVELDRSSGFDALDRSALETVKRWRFTPATRGDERVEAWVRVPIEFHLEDR